MTSLNRSQDIPQIYQAVEKAVYTDDKDKQDVEKSKVLLRMREGIFKSFVIIGYPKVGQDECNGFISLTWESYALDHQFAPGS